MDGGDDFFCSTLPSRRVAGRGRRPRRRPRCCCRVGYALRTLPRDVTRRARVRVFLG